MSSILSISLMLLYTHCGYRKVVNVDVDVDGQGVESLSLSTSFLVVISPKPLFTLGRSLEANFLLRLHNGHFHFPNQYRRSIFSQPRLIFIPTVVSLLDSTPNLCPSSTVHRQAPPCSLQRHKRPLRLSRIPSGHRP
jgi:hypothetical protein